MWMDVFEGEGEGESVKKGREEGERRLLQVEQWLKVVSV